MCPLLFSGVESRKFPATTVGENGGVLQSMEANATVRDDIGLGIPTGLDDQSGKDEGIPQWHGMCFTAYW